MAAIDRFVQALFEWGGEQVVVVSGQPVALLTDGGEQAVTEKAASRETVERLLREILPPDQTDGDGELRNGRYEFIYDAPAGRVNVRAYRTENLIRVTVTAVSSETDAASGAGEEPAARRGSGEETPGAAAGPPRDTAREPRAAGAGAPSVAGEGGPDAARKPEEAGPEVEVADGEGPPVPDSPLRPDAPRIHRLLLRMVEHGCSDLHLSAGEIPLFRKDGEMIDLGGEEEKSAEETREMLVEVTPERNLKQFEQTHDTDFGYEIEGRGRFRANLFMDRNGMGGVFRHIPYEIMTVDEIGLSDHVLKLCHRKKGLVVVTGPTGSGKSTTLAAMIDYINKHRREHIITIEDPIEYTHENKKCLVNQREVGIHTEGFAVALRAALREDPDVILVGELRDLETTEIALRTAETGHLVFGTLHTNTAASTVARIIDQYPEGQQGQIRAMLAETLEGVIAQTLCRRKEGGRVAALEVLLVTAAVSNLIREEKTFQIPTVIQTGSKAGMETLNEALIDLVERGEVHVHEAYRHAVDKEDFRSALDRKGIQLDAKLPDEDEVFL